MPINKFTFGLTLVLMTLGCGHMRAAPTQESFSSPEDAVNAMIEALRINHVERLSVIIGPGSEDLVSSGDPTADQIRWKQFAQLFEQKNRLEKYMKTG